MRKTDLQTYTNVALSATGLASAVAWASGGYTLAATTPNDSLGHLITFAGLAATDHSAKTVTVTGTDANDRPQTETFAGPNGVATKTSTKYFKTVTSVTISATTGADTFNIGWTAAAVGATVVPNLEIDYPLNIGLGCIVGTGSPNYSIQYTYDMTNWFTHSVITGKTANSDGVITQPVLGFRLIFSAAGQVTLTSVQAGRY